MSLVLSVGVLDVGLQANSFVKKVWGNEEETVECSWKMGEEDGGGRSFSDVIHLDGSGLNVLETLPFPYLPIFDFLTQHTAVGLPHGYSSQPRTVSLPKRYILFCSLKGHLG